MQKPVGNALSGSIEKDFLGSQTVERLSGKNFVCLLMTYVFIFKKVTFFQISSKALAGDLPWD